MIACTHKSKINITFKIPDHTKMDGGREVVMKKGTCVTCHYYDGVVSVKGYSGEWLEGSFSLQEFSLLFEESEK